MLKNYLKIAVRNLSRHKLFSFINIFGLALSMSVCMMVLIGLKDQLGYDTFHPHSDRTYRVITQLTNKQGSTYRFASSPVPLAAALTTDYHFIRNAVTLYPSGRQRASSGAKELSVSTAFTQPSFFQIFGFRLKAGNAQKSLSDPNSIILTKATAEKFFGAANPVGQRIDLSPYGSFQVTGVLDQPKAKSHIDFDCYLSLSSLPGLEKNSRVSPVLASWNPQIAAYTYVQLKEGASKKQLQGALTQIGTTLLEKSTLQGRENLKFEGQPLDKIILGEELQNSFGNVGSFEKSLGSLFVAFVILLSACFNYTNLSIARSLNRGKEVGIRKVSGAFRYQVFYQFILESILTAFLSLGLALVFLHLITAYAPFAGEVDLHYDSSITSWFLVFTIFTGLLAGSLPAWALSSFKPVEVLKNLSNLKLLGGNRFRNGLIVIQFVLALVIIIFTYVSSRQFNFIANADPGYRRENLLVIPTEGIDKTLFTTEIRRLTGVEAVTAASEPFGRNTSGRISVKKERGGEPMQIEHYDVDDNFDKVMGLQLVAGNFFVAEGQSLNERTAVINETAMQAMGFKTPNEAVGKRVWMNDSIAIQVAAVVKDFHFLTVAVPLGPLMLLSRPGNFKYVLVKTFSHDNSTVSQIETIWKRYSHTAFTSSWLKQDQYDRQAAWGTVSMLGFLAFMTIVIACMGLLGMVIYSTEIRRKEIGIRKVMGASVAAIAILLSKNFVKLVVIAGLIAMPIGLVVTFMFLQIFATHVPVGAAGFVFGFLGLLLLVLLTIGVQIFKVANANPVNSLRTE